MTPGSGHPSSLQDLPPTPSVVKASAPTIALTPPPLPILPVQEVTHTAKVSAPAALASPVVAPLSTVDAPLLSASMATTRAPVMPPSSAPPVLHSATLALVLTSTFSHPVFLSTTSTPLAIMIHRGVWVTSLNRRPWLALCWPLMKILFDQ